MNTRCEGGEIGKHSRLKICRSNRLAGSIPALRTNICTTICTRELNCGEICGSASITADISSPARMNQRLRSALIDLKSISLLIHCRNHHSSKTLPSTKNHTEQQLKVASVTLFFTYVHSINVIIMLVVDISAACLRIHYIAP